MKLTEITNEYGDEHIMAIIDPIYEKTFGNNGPSIMSDSDATPNASHQIEITVAFDEYVSSPLTKMMSAEVANTERTKRIETKAKEDYTKKAKQFITDLDSAFNKKKKRLVYQGFEENSSGAVFKFGS